MHFCATSRCATIFVVFVWISECKNFRECVLITENYICPLLSYTIWNMVGVIGFWPPCTIGHTNIVLDFQAHVCIDYVCVCVCIYIHTYIHTRIRTYIHTQKRILCEIVAEITRPGLSVDITAESHFQNLCFPRRCVNITLKAWTLLIPCQSTEVTAEHL